MASLKKEYFDKQITGLKKELKTYTNKTVKESAKSLEKNLKTYTDDKFENLNNRTARGFTNIQEHIAKTNVAERVIRLENEHRVIKHTLGLTL